MLAAALDRSGGALSVDARRVGPTTGRSSPDPTTIDPSGVAPGHASAPLGDGLAPVTHISLPPRPFSRRWSLDVPFLSPMRVLEVDLGDLEPTWPNWPDWLRTPKSAPAPGARCLLYICNSAFGWASSRSLRCQGGQVASRPAPVGTDPQRLLHAEWHWLVGACRRIDVAYRIGLRDRRWAGSRSRSIWGWTSRSRPPIDSGPHGRRRSCCRAWRPAAIPNVGARRGGLQPFAPSWRAVRASDVDEAWRAWEAAACVWHRGRARPGGESIGSARARARAKGGSGGPCCAPLGAPPRPLEVAALSVIMGHCSGCGGGSALLG